LAPGLRCLVLVGPWYFDLVLRPVVPREASAFSLAVETLLPAGAWHSRVGRVPPLMALVVPFQWFLGMAAQLLVAHSVFGLQTLALVAWAGPCRSPLVLLAKVQAAISSFEPGMLLLVLAGS
jgi:hypothetical protein